jgi:peptidoglycan/LPS O-acetylase OafA/YrhL
VNNNLRPRTGTEVRFEILDLSRGIAAIVVLLYHSYDVLGHQLVWRGYLAVDFFFLLSGFVLSHQYDAAISAGMGLREFMVRRLVRLYPCYLLAFLLGLLLDWTLTEHWRQHIDPITAVMSALSNLLVMPSPIAAADAEYLFPLNPATWSLLYELIASAVYCSTRRQLVGSRLLVVFGTLTVALALTGSHYGSIEGGWGRGQVFVALPRVLFSFFAGVLLRRYAYTAVPARWGAATVAAGLLALFAVFRGPLWNWGVTYELLAVAFVFPAVLVGLSRVVPTSALTPWCRLAGELSYPIYILQFPLMIAIHAAAGKGLGLRLGYAVPLAGILQVSLIALLAVAVAWSYERPLRRSLKNWLVSTAWIAAGARRRESRYVGAKALTT